jgi:hypothetical protein
MVMRPPLFWLRLFLLCDPRPPLPVPTLPLPRPRPVTVVWIMEELLVMVAFSVAMDNVMPQVLWGSPRICPVGGFYVNTIVMHSYNNICKISTVYKSAWLILHFVDEHFVISIFERLKWIS